MRKKDFEGVTRVKMTEDHRDKVCRITKSGVKGNSREWTEIEGRVKERFDHRSTGFEWSGDESLSITFGKRNGTIWVMRNWSDCVFVEEAFDVGVQFLNSRVGLLR